MQYELFEHLRCCLHYLLLTGGSKVSVQLALNGFLVYGDPPMLLLMVAVRPQFVEYGLRLFHQQSIVDACEVSVSLLLVGLAHTRMLIRYVAAKDLLGSLCFAAKFTGEPGFGRLGLAAQLLTLLPPFLATRIQL